MDILSKCMQWEEEGMSEEEEIEFFQELVNTGIAWLLQGCYGRRAETMLDARLISYPSSESDTSE